MGTLPGRRCAKAWGRGGAEGTEEGCTGTRGIRVLRPRTPLVLVRIWVSVLEGKESQKGHGRWRHDQASSVKIIILTFGWKMDWGSSKWDMNRQLEGFLRLPGKKS